MDDSFSAPFGLDTFGSPSQQDLALFSGQAQAEAYDLQESGSSGDDRTQHPTEEDPQRRFKRQEREAPGIVDQAGNAEKKKPGRKPITDQPTTKRKAQNRAAQRAFRERKENHVKQLQDRVAELEQITASQQQENLFLKQQLQRFRQGQSQMPASDTDQRRSFSPEQKFDPVGDRPFTFTTAYPSPQNSSISGAQSSGSHLRRASNTSNASPNDCPGLSPGLSSTNTSPQSSSEQDFFNPAALPQFSLRDPILLTRQASSASSVQQATQSGVLPAMMATVDAQTPFSQVASASTLDPLTEPLLFTGSSQQDFLLPMTSPKQGFAPAVSTNLGYRSNDENLDALDLFDDQLLFTSSGQFQPSAKLFGGVVDLPEPLNTQNKEDTEQPPIMACPEAWFKIVSHPKFETFDLDELCADMRSKAVCTAGDPASEVRAQELEERGGAEAAEALRKARMAMLDKAIESHANRLR